MADLAEDIVRNWLMSQGYFVIAGVRFKGQGEADFLAVKLKGDRVAERLHVEVHVSATPTTHLGQRQAGEGTDPIEGVRNFIQRKFFRPHGVKAIERIFGTKEYERVLVLGNVNKSDLVLKECWKAGVEVERFWRICRDLRMRKGRVKFETTDGRRFAQFLQLARQARNVSRF